MKIIIDTNVLISAVFFRGTPGRIIDLWRDGHVELLMTSAILAEYVDVAHRLHVRYSKVDPNPVISLLVRRGTFVQAVSLRQGVSTHRDDDKFLAAALGASANVIVSGDSHLLSVSGYQGIDVLTPAQFIKNYESEHRDSAK